jgi:protein-S-isoprenylcysteine O-methyltransferase Ste14
MRIVDFIFIVCWPLFWIYWIVASLGVKRGHARWRHFVGFRVGLVLVVLLLLRLRIIKGGHSPLATTTSDPLRLGLGLALFLLGLGLAVWARLYIGRNWGTPMSRKDDPELVTTGPYSTIRHPIYTGIILAMIGTAVAISLYWVIAVVILGGYFIYSAFNEEHYMAEQFPDTYPEYKSSTKMLIPFVV